ncbi:MAG: hypothetical protein V7668_03085 [Cereibacter changlensis]
MRRTRWLAPIFYRADAGLLDQPLHEITDLHDIVEIGPHWETIDRIKILRLNHNTALELTVEQAAKL